jgi:hypothetical protein
MFMKKIAFFIVFALVILLVLALIPVNTAKKNSIEVVGKVKSISEGGVKDLIIELEDDKITYYINRGFENGFNLQKTKNDFEGKEVVLYYAKNWTPLAPFGTTSKHITQLSINDIIVYSEWK